MDVKEVITNISQRNFFVFLISSVLLIGLACQGTRSIEFKKEKIIFRSKIEENLENLENKSDALQMKAEQEKPKAADSLDARVEKMESLRDQLNVKLGELDNVSMNDWQEKKTEINGILDDVDHVLKD